MMGSVLGIAHINQTNRRELFRSSIKTKYCLRAGKKALRSRKRSPLCATFATEADCIGRFPAGLSTCWLLGLLLVVLPGTLPQTHLLFCWVSEGPAAEWMSITIQTHIKYRVLLPVSCLSAVSCCWLWWQGGVAKTPCQAWGCHCGPISKMEAVKLDCMSLLPLLSASSTCSDRGKESALHLLW